MTQPATISGRPLLPPPGVPSEELTIARFRSHARRLIWSAFLLIGVCGGTAYFYGNLPAPFENWMLFSAAGALVLFGVVVPYLVWLSRSYIITTRRVIVNDGMFSRRRREMTHVRGYSIDVRRGILQRLWGAGTISLTNGVDAPLRLINIPSAHLVHETLVDQIEVSQILAHRDAQSGGDTGRTY